MNKLVKIINGLVMDRLGVLKKYKNSISVLHSDICEGIYTNAHRKGSLKFTIFDPKLDATNKLTGINYISLSNQRSIDLMDNENLSESELIKRGYQKVSIAQGLLDNQMVQYNNNGSHKIKDDCFYVIYDPKVNLYGHVLWDGYLDKSYKDYVSSDTKDTFGDLMSEL